MSPLHKVHASYVHKRRARVLTNHLAALIPRGSTVLDVGCGDGLLSRSLSEQRPDLDIRGVDVLARGDAHIPVESFDGRGIPHGDRSFDVVTFVDVLHHTEDPPELLREGLRVSRGCLVIKDHTLKGFLARPTLRFMDWVGNARHGVALPYNYWSEKRWRQAFADLGLECREWIRELALYPAPADWLFGRSLHFVARLEAAAETVEHQPPAAGTPAAQEVFSTR